MKADRILNHLKAMADAIRRGDKNEYILLLDTLNIKTNAHGELFSLGDYHFNINNNNGLSIDITNADKGKFVRHIPGHDYFTSQGVADRDRKLQEVIDTEFFDQTELLFKDMEVLANDMDENTDEGKWFEIN